MRFESVGYLRWSPGRLVLEVDPGIVEVARALVPKHIRLNRQKYAPHITVIRHLKAEEEAWLLAHPRWGGTREGEEVAFTYSPEVQIDETYYWLNAWSSRLEDVREELGLPRSDWYTEPPDHSHCFHATIGNTKSV